jgi:predicted small lipoprotein YifL
MFPRLCKNISLACLLCLTSCGAKPPANLPVPPSELVAPLPPEPVIGVGNTEGVLATYVADLREWGRTVEARFDALRVWATEEPR